MEGLWDEGFGAEIVSWRECLGRGAGAVGEAWVEVLGAGVLIFENEVVVGEQVGLVVGADVERFF